MLFGRRKPGYTTTVDGAADPEQVVLDLQKAEMAAKKKPKAEVFSIDAASETARRLKETGSTFDGSAAKAGEDVMAVVERETSELAAKQQAAEAAPEAAEAPAVPEGTDAADAKPELLDFLAAAPRCGERPLRRPAHQNGSGTAGADPGAAAGRVHPLPLGGGSGHGTCPAGLGGGKRR